jgi:hypothetical protein
LSDDLLAQFIESQADQMERIDQLGQELRGQMTKLQDSIGGLLDTPWHTALTHIEEASSMPPKARRRELELAKERLFEAWGVAKALLDRDPRSMDPAALKCPAIGQQIAAVYWFMGDPDSSRRWLAKAYTASRDQLSGQLSAVYDILVEKTQHPLRELNPFMKGPFPGLHLGLWTAYQTRDLLWNSADTKPSWSYPDGPGPKNLYMGRDLNLEARLMPLVELDGEAQLLRLTCLKAGVNAAALPKDAPRALIAPESAAWPREPWERGQVQLWFNQATLATINVPSPTGGATPLPSPLERGLNKRYRQLPWPPYFGDYEHGLDLQNYSLP